MEELVLRATGRSFEDASYDLRSLESVISGYRLIIDKTLPITLGKRTLTDSIKEDIGYAVRIERGSLVVLLEFIAKHPELVSMFSLDGGNQLATFVSKLIKDVLSFRRAVTDILEKGQKPSVAANPNLSLIHI